MRGVTIKHLRYFDALARTGGFRRAAEQCHISQPALSLQIKEFEGMIGSPLVERGARSTSLTPLGMAVAEHVADILVRMGELEAFTRLAEGGLAGPLRLGLIPTIAPYLLPKVMRALASRFPALDIQPREAVTERQLEGLLSAQLDMAVLALPVSEPGLYEYPLFSEPFMLVQSSTSSAPSPGWDLRSLATMRLILLEEGHCFRDQALSFCSAVGMTTREIIEGSSLSTLVQMVGAGIGVTLIPQMAVAVESQAAPVTISPFAPPAPSRTIGLVWRKTSPLHDDYRRIGDHLAECWQQGSV